MKLQIKFLIFAGIFLILLSGVFAFSGSSATYSTNTKFDFGVSDTNSTSTNFNQRFISGEQPVSQYISGTYSGRFGILDFLRMITSIVFENPTNNEVVPRGVGSTGEDDLGIINNSIDLRARVYDETSLQNISGAICYFYENNSLLGSSTTNSSGHCNYSYAKNSQDPGWRNFTVNYTYSSGSKQINVSSVNISLEKYITTLTASNFSYGTKYYHLTFGVLLINTTKSNATVTDSYYDPENITATALNSAGAVRGTKYYPGGGILRLAEGVFTTGIVVTYGVGSDSFIKWEVIAANDNYDTNLSSALHSDIGICQGDFGAWSAWSVCSGGSQSRTRIDSSGCTETETQACGSPPPSSCFVAGTKILMSDKTEKNIEDVEVGDKVLGYDKLTKTQIIEEVLELESPIRDHMCEILFTGNSKLKLTNEHPIYTKESWKSISPKETLKENAKLKVGKLNVGDEVLFANGLYDKIVSIKCWNEEIQTYNLKKVSISNNYYAENILVHNKGGDTCTNDCTSGEEERVCVTGSVVRIRTCGNYDTDSCTEWGGEQYIDCGESGQICQNGYCVSLECEDECSLGDEQSECLDDTTSRRRVCGNYDDDLCNEWSDWNEYPCEEGEECLEGECLDEDKICEIFGCCPEWECTEWEGCKADYNLQDLLEEKKIIEGIQKRYCKDITGCRPDKSFRRSCELNIPIKAKIVEWCFEEYVEISEIESGELVSRMKRSSIEGFQGLNKIDISFILTDFKGYCGYCFDGVKNYDETGVDCGGPSCPICLPKIKFFDWLFWLIIFLWILLLLLLLLLLFREDEEEKKKKKSFSERFKQFIKDKFSFKKKYVSRESIWSRLAKVFKPRRRIYRPVREVKIIKTSRQTLLGKLKKQLRRFKEEGYHGTAAIESEINKIKRREKSFVRRIIISHQRKVEQRKREKRLKSIRKKSEELQRLRKHKKSWFANLFKSHKRVKIIKKPEKRIKYRPSIIKRLLSYYKKKSAMQKSEKHRKKIIKEFKRKIKHEKKFARKKIKSEKKRNKKIEKNKRREKRRKVRKEKVDNFMKKIKEWRKQGYYGTAKLETELKKKRKN